jgi:hypothetical protein
LIIFALLPCFARQFFVGPEKIDRGAKEFVNAVQSGEFRVCGVTPVTAPDGGIVSREGVVFLFCVTVAVFVARAAGEQQGFSQLPPAGGVVTDKIKLGAAVAVKLKDFEYVRLV